MRRDDVAPRLVLLCLLVIATATLRSAPMGAQASVSAAPGYFRHPALRDDTLVFTGEGDLWRVPWQDRVYFLRTATAR